MKMCAIAVGVVLVGSLHSRPVTLCKSSGFLYSSILFELFAGADSLVPALGRASPVPIPVISYVAMTCQHPTRSVPVVERGDCKENRRAAHGGGPEISGVVFYISGSYDTLDGDVGRERGC